MSSIFNALFRSVAATAPPAPASAVDNGKKKVSKPTTQPSSPVAPAADEPRKRIAPEPTPASPVTSMHDAYGSSSPFNPGDGDHSYDITTSSTSEPTDILLPRGVPFVHRRRLLLQQALEAEGSPIKASSAHSQSTASRGKAITIRDPRDPTTPPAPKVASKPVQLTEWRKEQLRRQNPPRLIEPIVIRSVPTLHGQANLPYARNPSGVDSHIPDEAMFNPATFNLHENGAKTSSDTADLLVPHPSTNQNYTERQPPPAVYHGMGRPPSRLPYQQHIDMTHLPSSAAGIEAYKRPETVQPPIIYSSKPMPDSKRTPSEVLRAQMSSMQINRPLESIVETAAHAVPRPMFEMARKRSLSMTAPSIDAAQRTSSDTRTYVAPRNASGEGIQRVEVAIPIPVPPKSAGVPPTEEEVRAAKAILANSKADASVNWRMKTPANQATPRAPPSSENRYTPSSDRSDDAPHMTIDNLFEKFAPSSGLSPLTIKVNTPPHADPAVKEISQCPFTSSKFDLLRPATPDAGVTPSKADTSSEAIVEDLINLASEPDENAVPKRHVRKSSAKSKGTPGAGKLLKRNSGKGDKEDIPLVSVAGTKAKAPLGSAKTVAGAGKGKAPRPA